MCTWESRILGIMTQRVELDEVMMDEWMNDDKACDDVIRCLERFG